MPTLRGGPAQDGRVERAPGRRQLLGRRRLGDLAHEGVEPGGRGDQQPAGLLGLDAVGVRHVARGERRLAGAEDDPLAADEQRQLALEHVERLVVATVDVQRGHVAAPPALVEERERPAAGVPVDVDVDEVVDEPERLRPPARCGGLHPGAPFR